MYTFPDELSVYTFPPFSSIHRHAITSYAIIFLLHNWYQLTQCHHFTQSYMPERLRFTITQNRFKTSVAPFIIVSTHFTVYIYLSQCTLHWIQFKHFVFVALICVPYMPFSNHK